MLVRSIGICYVCVKMAVTGCGRCWPFHGDGPFIALVYGRPCITPYFAGVMVVLWELEALRGRQSFSGRKQQCRTVVRRCITIRVYTGLRATCGGRDGSGGAVMDTAEGAAGWAPVACMRAWETPHTSPVFLAVRASFASGSCWSRGWHELEPERLLLTSG